MEQLPLYNSRIIDTYIKLLRFRYPHVQIKRLLEYAGMESYEVADQGHWFSQEQIDKFYNRCVQLTGNEAIAREAGRFAASPGTLGFMRQNVLGLLGPLKAFTLIGKSATKFTRSSQLIPRKISSRSIEIIARTQPGVEEQPFQCENRTGYFEAVMLAFGMGAHTVKHPECAFRGGSECRYIISWRQKRSTFIKRMAYLAGLGSILFIGASLVASPWFAVTTVLPAGLIVTLSSLLVAERIRANEIELNRTYLWDASEQLTEQVERNYSHSRLTRKVGEILANKTTTDEVISSVIHVLENTLDYDRGLVMMAHQHEQRLEIRGAYGYADQHLDLLTNISFRLDNPNSRGMFVVSYREQKPFLVNDIRDVENSLSPKSIEFSRALGTRAFICVPIILNGESIGILAVDNMKTKKPLVASDVNLLMGISPAIAISIQNAQLMEAQAEQFSSTLQVLAASIDARDFLTAGHSEKVAEYAVEIANEMDLGDNFCHMVRTAALLHDYGKIGIPDSILKKQGPLTTEERAVIQTHPTKTKEILDKISFQGILKDIPEVAYAHHEHWNGNGYPSAIKGDQIPLGARIIAAADFYEAITSKRHYRDPMPADEAIRLLTNESGRQFQPEIVDAFLKCLARQSVCLLPDDDLKQQGNQTAPKGPVRQQRLAYRTMVSAHVAEQTISGNTVNISKGGLFVECRQKENLKEQMGIKITFSLPETNQFIQLSGTIAWINEEMKPTAANLPPGFGVRFDDIAQPEQEAIENFINMALSHDRKGATIQ